MVDKLLNPGAPSGRLDDSGISTGGDHIVLPAGTRKVVDAGGAKHFLTPDHQHYYVPPGEVGNFHIEDESLETTVMRIAAMQLPYADAVAATNKIPAVFAALDDLRKLGIDLTITATEHNAYPEIADAIERLRGARVQEYPKMRYHPEHGSRIVQNKDEEGDLGEGWHDNVDKATAAKKASAEPAKKEPPKLFPYEPEHPEEETGPVAQHDVMGDPAKAPMPEPVTQTKPVATPGANATR